MLFKLLISWVFLILPTVSIACTASRPIGFDRPARIAADCSFDRAGRVGHDFFGGAVVDLKNGRIGQRLSSLGVCDASVKERLMVADCTTLESILITGQSGPSQQNGRPKVADNHYGVENKLTYLYPPHGAVRLSSKSTVPDLERVASKHGYSHRRDVRALGQKKKNRINLFCGCKNYYPDSRGAALE